MMVGDDFLLVIYS